MIDKRQTRPRCHAYLPSGTRVSSLLPRASATQADRTHALSLWQICCLRTLIHETTKTNVILVYSQ